jgi:hypothetical protein
VGDVKSKPDRSLQTGSVVLMVSSQEYSNRSGAEQSLSKAVQTLVSPQGSSESLSQPESCRLDTIWQGLHVCEVAETEVTVVVSVLTVVLVSVVVILLQKPQVRSHHPASWHVGQNTVSQAPQVGT